MPQATLKLVKEYIIDLADPDIKQILEEALTQAICVDGPASTQELKDAIQNQLGEDMASLVDLDSILDSDFEITVPSDHGLEGHDSVEDSKD